jgi:3-phenylpropionate/trans-cinnamate dioxygenase ferredoxin subunit
VKVDVCALDEMATGTTRRVVVGKVAIALVRIDDDVYAIGDRCTHADISLSEGEVDCHARTLECWKHGSTFSLVDGHPQAMPATRPVPVYTAGVTDGRVWVVVDG